MISTQQLKSRLLKKISEFQSESGDLPNYLGFWDFDKKDIVLRIIGFKAYSPRTGKKIPVYATEVMRYYPLGKKMKSNKRFKGNGNHFAYIFDRAVKFPSGFNFTWGSYFSENDPKLIHLNTRKNGKPFKLYNTYSNASFEGYSEWGAVELGSEKYYNLWYKNESKTLLTPKEYQKIKEYKMPGLKTNLTFLKHIDGSDSIEVLHNYIMMSLKYKGLRIIFKNKLYKHLNEKFLKKVIIEDTKMFKKQPKNNIQSWYINLIKTDLEQAEKLNITNVNKVFKGEDPDIIYHKNRIRFEFSKAKADILGNDMSPYSTYYKEKKNKGTKQQQYLLKLISDNLYKLPIFKEAVKKGRGWIGSTKEEIKHLYDYLEYRMLDHEITDGILFDKNWKEAFDLLSNNIRSHKNFLRSEQKLNETLEELKKYNVFNKEQVGYDIKLIEKTLKEYPELEKNVTEIFPEYKIRANAIIEQIKFQERKEEERVKKENSKIEKQIIELADFLGIKETEIKKGENVDKYKLHAPLDFDNYNQHAKELNQCIYNNVNYAKRHIKKQKVLIYIEKNGEIFATAELNPNGLITGFTGKQTYNTFASEEDKIDKNEQKILEREIKKMFLPKIKEIIKKEGVSA